jgi:hypothetical protein
MEVFGPTQLIWLLIAVATISALCGYAGSALAQRTARHTRRQFVLGFLCGSMASAVLRARRRALPHLSLPAVAQRVSAGVATSLSRPPR